jgi:flavin reductase (DIM6/NTAB) family NADH-FMN oxidoreductase RutF
MLPQRMVSGMTGVQVAEDVHVDLKRNFQDAFGRVAATVGIVGVCDVHGDVHGMTATAISSLSNEPPSLIVLLNQENQTYRTICERKRFSVSFLSAGSEELADKHSRPGRASSSTPHTSTGPQAGRCRSCETRPQPWSAISTTAFRSSPTESS